MEINKQVNENSINLQNGSKYLSLCIAYLFFHFFMMLNLIFAFIVFTDCRLVALIHY